MALEGKWQAVPPQAFTANGNQFGLVTLADTAGFKVKQTAALKTSLGQPLPVQVKRVLSSTMLIVGAVDNKIASWTPLDISAYTTASGAAISAEEQNKNNIPWEDHYRAVYEGDPTVADRVIFVDKYGNFYDKNNPMPIIFDGTVSIGTVTITGNPFPIWDQAPGNITDAAFDTVYTYTSSNDATRIKSLEVMVSTPALVQVLINGVVIRQRWTSPMERNANFEFEEPRHLPNTVVLTVQAKVERFLWPSYDTFTALEGYLESP